MYLAKNARFVFFDIFIKNKILSREAKKNSDIKMKHFFVMSVFELSIKSILNIQNRYLLKKIVEKS